MHSSTLCGKEDVLLAPVRARARRWSGLVAAPPAEAVPISGSVILSISVGPQRRSRQGAAKKVAQVWCVSVEQGDPCSEIKMAASQKPCACMAGVSAQCCTMVGKGVLVAMSFIGSWQRDKAGQPPLGAGPNDRKACAIAHGTRGSTQSAKQTCYNLPPRALPATLRQPLKRRQPQRAEHGQQGQQARHPNTKAATAPLTLRYPRVTRCPRPSRSEACSWPQRPCPRPRRSRPRPSCAAHSQPHLAPRPERRKRPRAERRRRSRRCGRHAGTARRRFCRHHRNSDDGGRADIATHSRQESTAEA